MFGAQPQAAKRKKIVYRLSLGNRVFFVDSSTTSVVIMAVGENLVLSVTDPNGATNTLQTIIASGGTYLYEIINPVVGEHLLTLTSSNVKKISLFKEKIR